MVMSKRQITASDGELSPAPTSQDDGLSALQLPFLQNHEMTKFLNSSKDWVADGNQELDSMDDVESFSSNFQGHYPNVTSLYTADIGMGSQLVTDFQGHSVPAGFESHMQSHYGHAVETPGPNQRPVLSPFPRSNSSLYYGGQMSSFLSHGGANHNHSLLAASADHSKVSSPSFPDSYDQTGMSYMENSPMQQPLSARHPNALAYMQQMKSIPTHRGFDHEIHDPQFMTPHDPLGSRDIHPVISFNGENRPRLSDDAVIKESSNQYSLSSHLPVSSNLNLNQPANFSDDYLSNDSGEISETKKTQSVRYNFGRPPQRKKGVATANMIQGTGVSSKLLSFLPCFKEATLYDSKGNPVDVTLNAFLNGNFFLSETSPPDEKGEIEKGDEDDEDAEENDVPTENSQKSPQSDDIAEDGSQDTMRYELTFYRRNLFQVTATVSNAHNAVYAGNVDNPEKRSRILSLSLGVTVLSSQDKKEKQLIYCAPKLANESGKKDSKGDIKAEAYQVAKTEIYQNAKIDEAGESPSFKFIEPTASGYDDIVSWKRLQFRAATSHNGHRKSQHFFCVCVSVFAELENAQRLCVLTSYSRPIVVRGRNPRFYQNRNNIVISEIDENEHMAAAVNVLMEEFNIYREFIMKRINMSLNNPPPSRNQDLRQKEHFEAAYKVMEAYNKRKPILGVPKIVNPKTSATKGRRSSRNTTAKASSAVKNETSTDESAQKGSKKTMNERQAYYQEHYIATSDSAANTDSTRTGSKDEDYEYFPMPVNYWLPPVEVVYRPHVVHHPVQLPKTSGRTGFDPNKRYFSTVD